MHSQQPSDLHTHHKLQNAGICQKRTRWNKSSVICIQLYKDKIYNNIVHLEKHIELCHGWLAYILPSLENLVSWTTEKRYNKTKMLQELTIATLKYWVLQTTVLMLNPFCQIISHMKKTILVNRTSQQAFHKLSHAKSPQLTITMKFTISHIEKQKSRDSTSCSISPNSNNNEIW